MKKSLSLSLQAIYALITALQLIFVPNMLLGIFGFAPTSEVWIKVLGITLVAFVVVYYGVIQYGNKELIKITIYSRLTIVVGLVLLVATGQVATPLLLFAGVDLGTSIWTWFELKKA